uniref:ArsR family transcriptional regulator n=1 Tax=Geoglobus ahangari TaxID=113653 RepID=A0A7J3THR2_9EURY
MTTHTSRSRRGEIFVTDVSFLTPQKLQLLEAIKKYPKSIRELVKKVGGDVKNVYLDIKELEKAGVVKLKTSGKAKKVELKLTSETKNSALLS